MKKIALIGAAAVAFAAMPALAQMNNVGSPGRGAMTRADLQARVARQFARTDANRDGFVTLAEAQAQRAARGERRGMRRDGGADRFAQIDRDGNGSISRAEFDAHHANAREHHGERRAERAERRAERIERRATRGLRVNERQFARVDTNRDGRLTLAEAQVRPLARFTAADTNRDGTLTRDERRAQREKRQARRAERREG